MNNINMLQPGGKNWLSKYFELVDQGLITFAIPNFNGMDKDSFLHAHLFPTGISFGYATELLFAKDLDTSSWTVDEKLKLVLFESLLLVYLVEDHAAFSKTEFVAQLNDFYAKYGEAQSKDIFKFFRKDSPTTLLEKVLSKRVHIKRTFVNMLWVSYLSNSLVYLDVLAFKHFLSAKDDAGMTYDFYVKCVLQIIIMASYSDGVIEQQERTMLQVFLSSANMSNSQKEQILEDAKRDNIQVENLQLPLNTDNLFKHYLLDLAVLTIYSDEVAQENELQFIQQLYKYLNIPNNRFNDTLVLIERFILENDHRVAFLQSKGAYDRIYKSFSKRWIKVLGRNREKLVEELKQNKELIALVNKSLVHELTTEEKDKVKHHFFDLIKTMPALAIFMLPGGALLLPIILKIIPDLIPSSFRQNKLDSNRKDK